MLEISPIMLALCFMLSSPYYAKKYARIINSSLLLHHAVHITFSEDLSGVLPLSIMPMPTKKFGELLRVEVKYEQEFGLLNWTIDSWSENWTGIWTNELDCWELKWNMNKILDYWIRLLTVEVKIEQEFGQMNWTIESWSEIWTRVWTIELDYWQLKWKLNRNLDKWIGLLRVEVKYEQEFGLLNWTIESWSER